MQDILSPTTLDFLTTFRKSIHKHPERSGQEKQTAQRIINLLEKLKPDALHTGLAGHGLVAEFHSGKPGPVVLFRADLDALPIQEVNEFEHQSVQQGVGHMCGHDGHMTILSGLAMVLSQRRPETGKVVLLYQPEEETGQGAEKILKEQIIQEIQPDWVFALHNLPGYTQNAVVIKEGPFAAASKGMIIKLEGRSSHAAHPEQGNSPVLVMAHLIRQLMNLPMESDAYKDFTLLTIIHARLGEIAFGTNPGKAVVMATLRTFHDKDMELLTQKAELLVNQLCKSHDIQPEISYTEVFPATINHPEAARQIKQAAETAACSILEINEPFRWSEDFGHFTAAYRGALFGLGAGEQHPSLHNNNYDFPDQLISTGIKVFYNIIDQNLNKKELKDV